VTFDNAQLDDLIIARSDGSPTYNFTVIIDDYDMRISHVIRGDDHLNNTPRQMNMLAALGAEPPQYAHLPMILGADGAKLSKRHGAVDIREYEDSGYLREALLNYLVRLGWSSGDQEIFTIDEMIDLFDIADVNQSASSFNPEKLLWLNQQHIIRMPSQELGAHLVVFLKKLGIDPDDGPAPEDVAEGFRERADTLVMMAESSRYCYEDFDEIEAKAAKKHLRPAVLEPMKAICAELSALSNWQQEDIHAAVTRVADKYDIGLGKLGQPMRVAVTGGPVSPPIDVTVFLVGRDRAVARLNHAIDLIEARAASGRQ
jgi:glutamyl-tRNA synthetase